MSVNITKGGNDSFFMILVVLLFFMNVSAFFFKENYFINTSFANLQVIYRMGSYALIFLIFK